jgi:hypothetical protein
MLGFSLDRLFNFALAKEPMNWAIVFIIATVWLLAFHSVMVGFGAMQAPTQGAFGGPGQVAAPIPDVTQGFSQPGLLGGTQAAAMSSFFGSGASPWTDGAESKYAEDGWVGG